MDEPKFGWIDRKYVAACLKRDASEVQRFWIRRAVGKGDNYASTLLRITVQVAEKAERKEREANEAEAVATSLDRFLIKCLPEGLMKTLIQDAGMWNKEVFMYRNVLPVIEDYVGCKIGPKCLNSYKNASANAAWEKEIVLEDLSYKFKMADRREQLDYEHCAIVMKKLARFHAGSVAMRRTHKEYIDIAGEELCFQEMRKETNELYLRQPFKNLAEHLKGDPLLNKYSKGLKNFGERFWDLAFHAAKPKAFNVLNHGDLWTNNILFEYDESSNNVIDARLIDFQCSRYTTPAFDLQYFFMSSVKPEVRETKLNELIDIYLENLNNELEKLNEVPLSKEHLYSDLMITDCYGLYASIFVQPISIREPESIDDSDDILNTETDNTFSKCIQGKRFQDMLPNILSYYENKGLFEEGYDNTINRNYYKETESIIDINTLTI